MIKEWSILKNIFQKIMIFQKKWNQKAVIILFLPLPCSRDGKTICGTDGKLNFDDLKKYLKKDGIIFGGKIPEKVKITLEKDKIIWYDYFNEETEQKNAAATAEGVVKILIENTPAMLSEQKILLIGAGRITEYLAPLLKAFGSDIAIATSSSVKKAKIKMHGFKAVDIEKVTETVSDYNICVNTSPCFKIDVGKIDKCKDLLYVELALKYEENDIENAHKKSINILCAPGIPTVYSR